MEKQWLLIAIALLFCLAGKAQAEGTSFFYGSDYNRYSEKMAPNGKYLAGQGIGSYSAFLWENKGNGASTLTNIDNTRDLRDVNDDGVIAGQFYDPRYIYDGKPVLSGGVYKNGVWYSLGLGRYKEGTPSVDKPMELDAAAGSMARAITKDGWVFGLSYERDNVARPVPMVWKPDPVTGEYTDTLVYRFPEDDLPPRERMQGSRFNDVSADGSVACGWAVYKETRGSYRPIVWTSPSTYKLIQPDKIGTADGISPNGKYVAITTGGQAALYDVENDKLTVFGLENTKSHAVSNEGIVIGTRGLASDGSKTFLWSDKLGYMELREFMDTYLPEVTLPEDFQFNDPESAFMIDFPSTISGDGLIFAGWRGVPTARKAWVVGLSAPLDLVSRPHDLTVNVNLDTRNVVQLSWTAPTDYSNHRLDFYMIYRNGEPLVRIAGDQTIYSDANAPDGTVLYHVSAIYDDDPATGTFRESGKSDPATAVIVDTYNLPFYDGFDTGFQTHYWEIIESTDNTWMLIKEGFNNPLSGVNALFVAVGDQSAYSHSLTSKPLDGKGKDKITASFLYKIAPYSFVGVRDTIHFEISTDIHGTQWNTVKSYLLRDSIPWTVQSLDITDWAKDRTFRLRFRAVSGSNRNYVEFALDELAVAAGSIAAAQGVKARKTADGKVEVIWQDPAGSYGLTYAKTDCINTIGNEGVPFIGANRFKADTLAAYQALKLTSVSAYINGKKKGATVDTKLKLAVFVDGNRVNAQPVESFRENAWNTFPLDHPVAISDVTNELTFGIEVAEHDLSSLPLTTDYTQTLTGLGDVFSEDNGLTWETLSAWNKPYSWSIVGNVRSEAAANERTGGILGYEIYRNGTKLDGGPTTLIFGQTYLDDTMEASPCYTVQAYYTIGGLAALSEAGCLNDVGMETISTSEPIAYPNPTTGKVSIQSGADQMPEIIVSNLVGERLLHTRGNSLDLSGYARGVYLLQVAGKTIKLIKR